MVAPSAWTIFPFVILLAAIALGPLAFGDWWSKHYPKVSLSLGAITLLYCILALKGLPSALHVGHEYGSFIALIGSLFVVSGGIHIQVKGEATPHANVIFLFIGALLANVLGTTGASMLLIRPWIRMNKYRVTGHHIVFFIFIVSNVGGCLTPIGDPPLFLGYVKGVPFWWVAKNCWSMWLVGVLFLLAGFYFLDARNYHRAPREVRASIAEAPEQWRFEGLWNIAFLGIILGAVFINHPAFLREAVMATAAAGSYFSTKKKVHAANHFNLHPVKEVAILFAGIFATMLPAVEWLKNHANALAGPTPAFFYWGSGLLSSVLDNAPTYLSFLGAAIGLFIDPQVTGQIQQWVQHGGDLASITGPHAEEVRNAIAAIQHYNLGDLARGKISMEQIELALLLGNVRLERFLVAISVGAVFFGANTYIGNGPNFMVKAIADQQKVHTPGFLSYILKYSLVWMLPLLVLLWLLFFRQYPP